MLSGVAKSGSPISRWTISRPSASRRLARAKTSKAPSVPRRDIRSANLTGMLLVHAAEHAAVDRDRLPCDVAGLLGAEKRADRAVFLDRAQPAHGDVLEPVLRH